MKCHVSGGFWSWVSFFVEIYHVEPQKEWSWKKYHWSSRWIYFRHPTKPMVFWKLFFFAWSREKRVWCIWWKSEKVHPNNQNDTGTLLERYPEGHTRQGGENPKRMEEVVVLSAWGLKPNWPKVSSKQAISYLSHFSQAKLAFPWQGSCEPSSFLWIKKDEISPKLTAKSMPGPPKRKSSKQHSFKREILVLLELSLLKPSMFFSLAASGRSIRMPWSFWLIWLPK